MIKTTIIIPVFNTYNYVRECLISIFSQTQKDIEVIAINDGSTDNSLDILMSMKQEYPELVVVSQENHGLGYTRNVGVEMAKGEYILFIDSDDCLRSDALEVCYQYASESQLDFLMFDADAFGDKQDNGTNFYDRKNIIKEQREVLSGTEFLHQYFRKSFCPSACLVYLSRKFLLDNNIYFLPKAYYEDNLFHCMIMSCARKIMYIPETLYRRRYRSDSITTSTFDTRRARDLLTIVEEIRKICNYKIHKEINSIANSILKGLITKCKNNGLLEDYDLDESIYESIVRIYGKNPEDIDDYEDTDTICKVYSELPEDIVPKEKMNSLLKQRKELFYRSFSAIPLNEENKKIGIYGMGKYSTRFLEDYENYVGEIRAEMIYIDSYRTSLEKDESGKMVYNVNNIGNIPLDCIVIASIKYEEEMYCTIRNEYGEKFKIVRLCGDLNY